MESLIEYSSLIGAILAAIVATIAALVSRNSAIQVANLNAKEKHSESVRDFRRSRILELKSDICASFCQLEALSHNTSNVPWLNHNDIHTIAEQGNLLISQLALSTVLLNSMTTETNINELSTYDFKLFCSSQHEYKDQIEAGNIDLNGYSNEHASDIVKRSIERDKKWFDELARYKNDLVTLLGGILNKPDQPVEIANT